MSHPLFISISLQYLRCAPWQQDLPSVSLFNDRAGSRNERWRNATGAVSKQSRSSRPLDGFRVCVTNRIARRKKAIAPPKKGGPWAKKSWHATRHPQNAETSALIPLDTRGGSGHASKERNDLVDLPEGVRPTWGFFNKLYFNEDPKLDTVLAVPGLFYGCGPIIVSILKKKVKLELCVTPLRIIIGDAKTKAIGRFISPGDVHRPTTHPPFFSSAKLLHQQTPSS